MGGMQSLRVKLGQTRTKMSPEKRGTKSMLQHDDRPEFRHEYILYLTDTFNKVYAGRVEWISLDDSDPDVSEISSCQVK